MRIRIDNIQLIIINDLIDNSQLFFMDLSLKKLIIS